MTNKTAARTVTADCPDCGEKVHLQTPVELGYRLNCPECGADLEVINVSPVELDWVYEDYDYDEEEDQDY
jgi:lysine biosynthesis protein LysW